MRLLIDGRPIVITHMGRDFILVDDPAEHAPCEAEIVMKVDDSESQWKVKLPEGMSRASRRVTLAVAE